MLFHKFLLIISLSLKFSHCQNENKDEESVKNDVETIAPEKLSTFPRLIVTAGLYNPVQVESPWKAFATLSSEMDGLNGTVSFHQWGPHNVIRVTINATGLPPGKHAVHIHAFGDVSQGCNSTGPHMHSNFIGNIEAKNDGTANVVFFSPYLRMFGYHGIVGRSVVIHEKPIELYVQPELFGSPYPYLHAGNAIPYRTEENQVGLAIACGPITITENLP